MRILFITHTRIGDAILSTGLLSHLIDAYPGARLTVACGPAPAELLDSLTAERVEDAARTLGRRCLGEAA